MRYIPFSVLCCLMLSCLVMPCAALCCVVLCCVVVSFLVSSCLILFILNFQVEKQVRSLKRRARSNLMKDRIDDPEDNVKYLVFPVEENSPDAIEIYRGDLKRLKAPQYLNDSLIDLKIKLIIKELPEEKRIKVRIFFDFFFVIYVEFFCSLYLDVIFYYLYLSFPVDTVVRSRFLLNQYRRISSCQLLLFIKFYSHLVHYIHIYLILFFTLSFMLLFSIIGFPYINL